MRASQNRDQFEASSSCYGFCKHGRFVCSVTFVSLCITVIPCTLLLQQLRLSFACCLLQWLAFSFHQAWREGSSESFDLLLLGNSSCKTHLRGTFRARHFQAACVPLTSSSRAASKQLAGYFPAACELPSSLQQEVPALSSPESKLTGHRSVQSIGRSSNGRAWR